MKRAADSYGPLGIDLVLKGTNAVYPLGYELVSTGCATHSANCEGALTSDAANDFFSSSLMLNAVNFASINFSTLSGSVVRGHAVNHAAP